MTHTERIRTSAFKVADKSFHENAWGRRHYDVVNGNVTCKPEEIAVLDLIQGAATYADQHAARYGSKIGDDGVLGDHWAAIVRSILGLLNGECGRLDCGTLDRLLRDMLIAEGFNDD